MSYTQSILEAARTVAIQQSEMPAEIEQGWVRLRLATASICGTDMHYFRHFANAGFELDYPVSLGHEACGIIDDPNGCALQPGQLVAINPLIPCLSCERCDAGDVNMCQTKRFPGSATTKPHIHGFFRDRFDFPARCLHPVDTATDPDHLTFAEPLACAMHCINKAGTTEHSKVLVTGCGPMGLLAVIAAVAKGAHVDVTDIKRPAVEAAKKVGASGAFVSGEDDLSMLQEQYHIVIEASGSPHGYNQALAACRKQGTIGVLSLIQPSNVPIDLHLNALKEINSIGSILFTNEFAQAVALIEKGSVDFEAIIAARYSVAHTQQACELMASGQAIGKVLIKPETAAS
jgi:L-idonate 5-dehydrogenase